MVRSYDTSRPVPEEVIDRIMHNGLRAPSAGFSQGWGFLVLDNPADVARFRDAVRPEADAENWFAANVDAPLMIVAHSNKDAYLDRYARPDKGFVDRSDAWWPAPYWDIDTGFASLLMMLTAVDSGLGASLRSSCRSAPSPSATAASRRAICAACASRRRRRCTAAGGTSQSRSPEPQHRAAAQRRRRSGSGAHRVGHRADEDLRP